MVQNVRNVSRVHLVDHPLEMTDRTAPQQPTDRIQDHVESARRPARSHRPVRLFDFIRPFHNLWLVPQGGQHSLVLPPTFFHLDPKLEENLHAEEALHLDPGLRAHRL